MTFTEVRDILDNRVNWKDSGGYLSSDNTTTDSGRYFQDEHSAVTLDNIRDCQPEIGISDADFNTYLSDLRKSVVLQVIADVYGAESKIKESEITDNVGVFDNAISLGMVVKVMQLIITSTRSNRTESISKEFVNKLAVELNGHVDAKWIGFRNRYNFHIKELKKTMNSQSRINTITIGNRANYELRENKSYWDRHPYRKS